MLRKRGSFRQKLPQAEMNVVSLMDILTTLLFFLLVGASFTHMSGLDAGGFITAQMAGNPDKKPVFTLEVIIENEKQATVWLGPLTGLQIIDTTSLSAYLKTDFQGDAQNGFTKRVEAANLPTLLAGLQIALIPIKRSFPHELAAVAAFSDQVTYQQMVDTLSAVRALGDKQEGFELVNAIGQREKTRVLFPSVTISEWTQAAGNPLGGV